MCLAYSFGEKEHYSPSSVFKELVYRGDLGFRSFINHVVWTAGIRRKLHISRPRAIPWSGDEIKDSIYYPRLTLGSVSPTQILALGVQRHEEHFSPLCSASFVLSASVKSLEGAFSAFVKAA